MPEIIKNCPLCGQDNFTKFDQRDFRGFEVTNVLCSNCGLVFQSPRIAASELNSFYQDEYRVIYNGYEGPSEKDLKVQKARAENLVKFLNDLGIENVERYLDIGSSAGLLIEEVRDTYGCEVVGIEPGDAYRDYAHSKGFNVYEEINQIEGVGEARFDLVSMIHVLEHIPDPVDYLHTLREEFLTESAMLLIEVPNLYAHDCFEVAHLSSFSQETLTQVLKKAGYRTIFLERHGYPRSKLIPLYISLLAEPSKERIDPEKIDREKLVKIKRSTGFLHRRVIERFFPTYGWVPEYRS